MIEFKISSAERIHDIHEYLHSGSLWSCFITEGHCEINMLVSDGVKKDYPMNLILRYKPLFGITLALFSLVLAALAWRYPRAPETLKQGNMIGTWQSDYCYGQSGTEMCLRGETTFFTSGKYNYHGTLSVGGKYEGNTVRGSYLSDGAGNWVTFDDRLLISLESLKSTPVSIVFNSQKIKPGDLKKAGVLPLPAPEDMMANGK